MAYKLTSLGDGAWLSLIDLRAFKTAHQRASAPECQVKGDRITADERDSVKTVTEEPMELLQANPGIQVRGILKSWRGRKISAEIERATS